LCYIPVGQWPFEMYVNTLRRKLYVLNSDGGSISVVDIATNQVTRTVAVGEPYVGYYYSRVDKFYCGVHEEVVVLDGRGDTVVARIPVAPSHDVGAISGSDTRDVVVAAAADMDTRFYAINAATDAIDTIILAGDWCDAIYWSPLSDRFFCISDFTNEVIVLSGDGRRLLMTLPVGKDPYVFAASPVQRRLYVGHLGCHRVYVIRDAEGPGALGSEQDTVFASLICPSLFQDRLVMASGAANPLGEVRIFAQDGRLVRSMNVTGSSTSGQRLIWDGRDSQGRLVPPGVYVVTATGGTRAKAVKLK
jgi:YVTN family beta-propeller protein